MRLEPKRNRCTSHFFRLQMPTDPTSKGLADTVSASNGTTAAKTVMVKPITTLIPKRSGVDTKGASEPGGCD